MESFNGIDWMSLVVWWAVLGAIVAVFLLCKKLNRSKDIDRDITVSTAEDNLKNYRYRAKTSIMTRAEERTYRRLVEVFDRKFYVIPQVYLATIFDYKIRGQDWYGAFQHINRKSVDCVLLNKSTLKLVCAVELDDYTHEWHKRQLRDREVERIFKLAGMPLVRIQDITQLSNSEIISVFADAINA